MPPPSTPRFIGRKAELRALRDLRQQPGSHIAVIYGRRRVGKTALVNHAYAGELLLSFEGLENKGKQQQIRNFLFQLEQQTQTGVKRSSSIREWREALVELVPLVRKARRDDPICEVACRSRSSSRSA
jgi:uncharacterized protein